MAENPEEYIQRMQIQQEIESEMHEDLQEDQVEDDMDDQNDIQEDLQDLQPGAIPHQEEHHSTLKFLQDILDSPDRYKTANLTWEELGRPTFSTRFWLNLSNTCDKLFDLPLVAAYCRMKAGITSDTSLSREGFMISTSVTQRKLKEKKNSSELAKFLRDKG